MLYKIIESHAVFSIFFMHRNSIFLNFEIRCGIFFSISAISSFFLPYVKRDTEDLFLKLKYGILKPNKKNPGN